MPEPSCCVNAPFTRCVTFILYFVSLWLTSIRYRLHQLLALSYLRMFLIILFYVTFYLRTISNSRLFVVTILTWSIQDTVSVLWSLLVHCVATIHKKVSKNHLFFKLHTFHEFLQSTFDIKVGTVGLVRHKFPSFNYFYFMPLHFPSSGSHWHN